MAYSAVVSLIQTISKILDDHDQYSISIDERHQLISLDKYVISLEAFLENFPDKATRLEGRIRDVANAAEDALEYFMREQIFLRDDISSRLPASPVSDEYSGQTSCISTYVKRMPSGVCVKEHGFHIDFRGFEKVMEEVSGIAGEVMDMKNTFTVSEVQVQPHGNLLTASSSSTMGSIVKSEMVGFKDDLLAVKARLCGESPKLQVIPIVGMGGIGKTTLARNVYDDSLIVEHFHIRVWVTVSQDYKEDVVLSQLLLPMGESNKGVYQSLKGRRYLIVFDDMWSTKVWDDLRRLFPDDHNGSRIMLTTRILDVANCVSSNGPPHEMDFMDEEQSWNLLEKMVFKKENCPPDLENIGRMIARNCRGLPLAIVVIAGILLTLSKPQTSWKNVAEDVMQVVMTNDDGFAMRVLSLSYKHLPQHLRQCFLHMGCFPEDYKIYATNLINLWVGEGFLKPSGCMSMEEWGEECLSELVRRNLVLVIEKKANEEIKICGMHDVVRELCIRKSHEEKFLLHVMDGGKACLGCMRSGPRRICSIFGSVLDCLELMDSYITGGKVCLGCMRSGPRRICIFSYIMDVLETINASTTHTIVCFGEGGIMMTSLANCRLLRVLDVENVSRAANLNELFELFHLRYLAFDPFVWGVVSKLNWLVEVKIPATILNLVNLQILIVNRVKSYHSFKSLYGLVVRLPLEFWRMTQLRHVASRHNLLVELSDPEGVPACILENMRSLSKVRNFVFSRRVIERIPNLNKLGIRYDYKREDWNHQDYQFENMVFLHQLEKLKMKMPMYVHNPYWHKFRYPAFPRALKELSLSSWQLPRTDMSVIGLLSNLQVLKLKIIHFQGETWETHEGEFLRLKCLLIQRTNLKHWITESSHFPMLNRLRLHRCLYLDEIPEGVGDIATLELLEVSDNSNEGILKSAKRIKEEQHEYGNDAFQLRILSS